MSALFKKSPLLLQKLAASKQAEFQKNWCGPSRKNSDSHWQSTCTNTHPASIWAAGFAALSYLRRSGALAHRGLSTGMKESMLSVELGFQSSMRASLWFWQCLLPASTVTLPFQHIINVIWYFSVILSWNFQSGIFSGRIQKDRKDRGGIVPFQSCHGPHHSVWSSLLWDHSGL